MSQLAEAFVKVRPLATGFGSELDRQTGPALRRFSGQLRQTEREASRFGRGALVGTGALQGLGRAAAFASTSFIGGAGLVYAIKASVNQATEQTRILSNLQNAVKASGQSWSDYRVQIEQATQKTKALSAFDDEELYGSLQTLIRATGDVTKSLKLNALAADIARGSGKSLAAVSLAVAKTAEGQTGALKRYIPAVVSAKTSTEALRLATEKYAGASEAFTKTAAGSQERLTVAIQDTEKAVGRALLPTITRLQGRLSDWLGNTKNQERIQRDVNQAVKVGTGLVKDISGALKTADHVIEPVVDHLGGLKKTLELIAALLVANKVRNFATALGFIGPAAKTAAVEVGALNTQLAVLEGGGIGGSAGKVAKVGILSRLASALGPAGFAVAAGYTLGQIFDKNSYSLNELYKKVGKGDPTGLAQKVLTSIGAPSVLRFIDVFPALRANLLSVAAVQSLKVRFATDGDYNAALAYAKQNARAAKGAAAAVAAAAGRATPDLPGGVGGSSAIGLAALTARARNQLALTQAAGTPGTADDLRALAEQRRLLGRAIETETDRLRHALNAKQAQKFADNLQALTEEDNRAAADIANIEQAAADKAAAARQKIKDAADRQERINAQLIADATRASQKRVAAMGKLGDLLIKNVKAMFAKRRAAAAAIASVSRGTFEKPIDLPGKIGGSGRVGGGAGGGYTLEQLFEEASSEFALYGSNVGGPGTPLSPQDARGAFAGTVKTHQTTVVQNFYGQRDTGQAMRDAQSVARNAK